MSSLSRFGPFPVNTTRAQAEKAASEKKDFERVATPKLVRALWDVASASKCDASTRVAACRFLATCCSAVGSKVVDGPSLNDAAQFVVVEESKHQNRKNANKI